MFLVPTQCFGPKQASNPLATTWPPPQAINPHTRPIYIYRVLAFLGLDSKRLIGITLLWF